MKKFILLVVLLLLPINIVSADTFGTGEKEFTIDFVNISGDASSANGTNISGYSSEHWGYKTFTDPGNDYRMGTFEITNDQWDKFKACYGTATGNPSNAYDLNPYFTGTDVPTNNLSWYEGVQFVNYLNTSTGYAAAYKFTGTQGTDDYTFALWQPEDLGYDADNPFRNSNAKYFMPTEDEWVKAAYWNGTSLQGYATKLGDTLYQGNGSNGGWNYYDDGYVVSPPGHWSVGSGSEELNGTFDMMGNAWELTESLFSDGGLPNSLCSIRGGDFQAQNVLLLGLTQRGITVPYNEDSVVGFRVASVPEPCSLVLLSVGILVLRRRKA